MGIHFVTMLLAAVIMAAAQPMQSTLLLAGSTAPAGRSDGTIVHDPADLQLFLFGGSASRARDGLWVLFAGASGMERATAAVGPYVGAG